jgi:hypothetical protein
LKSLRKNFHYFWSSTEFLMKKQIPTLFTFLKKKNKNFHRGPTPPSPSLAQPNRVLALTHVARSRGPASRPSCARARALALADIPAPPVIPFLRSLLLSRALGHVRTAAGRRSWRRSPNQAAQHHLHFTANPLCHTTANLELRRPLTDDDGGPQSTVSRKNASPME